MDTLSEGTGSEVMGRIAAPMVGGMITAPLLSLFVIPVIYYMWKLRSIVQQTSRTASHADSGGAS